MIKENQKYLNRIQLILDIIALFLSFMIAFFIRFYTDILSPGIISIPFRDALEPIIAIIPIYIALYSLMELYSTRRIKSIFDEFKDIAKANTFGILILILLLFALKLINFSRYLLGIFYFSNIIMTSVIRITVRLILKRYRKKGYNLKHCLVIGCTDITFEFFKKVEENPQWGYNIFGILDDSKKESKYKEIKIIGNLSDISQILKDYYVDMVVITIDTSDYDKLGMIISECEKAGVKTNIIPYYYKYIPSRPYMDDLDGLPMIDTRHVPLDNIVRGAGKRIFDVLFSSVVLLAGSPLFMFLAIITKLTSKGPVLFKQERVGLNRQNFIMYKFRSMEVLPATEEKYRWTTENDARKTKWGNFIRKTSLDELPQFFNVLKGDMSIVGPRPERPFFVERFKEEIPKYMIKHQVRPGITGWAQIHGLRGDTSITKRIEFDIYYIENWTFTMDINIVFKTLVKGILTKNAY